MTVTRGYDTVGVAELKEWVPVGPRGTVEAVTVAHIGLDGEPLASCSTE